MKSPDVSIIIPNYNGAGLVEDTIRSVLTNTSASYKLVIVDDASTDNSPLLIRRMIRKYSHAQLIIHERNKGTASAINTGIRKSKTPFIAVLGFDMSVEKNWLSETIRYLKQRPRVGAGQLKILRFGTNHFDSAGELLTPFGFLAERAQEAEDSGQFDYIRPIFSGKGTATIFRRDVLEKTGLFDASYRMYWEEPDLFWRIWKTGYRVEFLYQSKTWHKYLTGLKPLSRSQQINATYFGCRNHIITIIKNATGLRGVQMFISVIGVWFIFLLIFLATFDFKRSYAIVRAIGYILLHIQNVVIQRRALQKRLGGRYKSDSLWYPLIGDSRSIGWYAGKMWAYCLGKPY